jgi:hypothetical protein
MRRRRTKSTGYVRDWLPGTNIGKSNFVRHWNFERLFRTGSGDGETAKHQIGAIPLPHCITEPRQTGTLLIISTHFGRGNIL